MATIPKDAVRLLISDVSSDPAKQLLTNTQIETFLELEDGNVKLAAAQALDTIASSETLVAKVIKTQDLSTDGPKTAADLRAHAKSLRAQVAVAASEADDGFFFGTVSPVAGTSWPELTERPY